LIQYCDVGGNLILTGWSLRNTNNVAKRSPPLGQPPNDPFYEGIIHVKQDGTFDVGSNSYSLIIPGTNLIGAYGQPLLTNGQPIQYPDIQWDTTKLNTPWHGALPGQWVAFPDGFGEAIYRIKYKPNIQTFDSVYSDQPLAVRYIGGNPRGNPPGFFNCVFFAFPLYYVDPTIAEQVLQQALSDVGFGNKNP